MASRISITGTITDLPGGTKTISPVDTTNTAVVGQTTSILLASGFNSISVPTNAKGCIIAPNTANTASIILKGVTGDTGVTLSKVSANVLTFDTTPPATIGLTAGALQTLATDITFF